MGTTTEVLNVLGYGEDLAKIVDPNNGNNPFFEIYKKCVIPKAVLANGFYKSCKMSARYY